MKSIMRVGLLVMGCLFLFNTSYTLAQASFFDFLQDKNINKPAVDFTLRDLKGNDVNMTKYRNGKKAIIFFWATWCPHCRTALKGLTQEKADIEAKNIKIIIVDVGEASDEVREHILKNKINLDVLVDTDSTLAEPYNIEGVPTFYYVDEGGIVRAIEHSLPKNYEQLFVKSN